MNLYKLYGPNCPSMKKRIFEKCKELLILYCLVRASLKVP